LIDFRCVEITHRNYYENMSLVTDRRCFGTGKSRGKKGTDRLWLEVGKAEPLRVQTKAPNDYLDNAAQDALTRETETTEGTYERVSTTKMIAALMQYHN
jgi:hypothetical protein